MWADPAHDDDEVVFGHIRNLRNLKSTRARSSSWANRRPGSGGRLRGTSSGSCGFDSGSVAGSTIPSGTGTSNNPFWSGSGITNPGSSSHASVGLSNNPFGANPFGSSGGGGAGGSSGGGGGGGGVNTGSGCASLGGGNSNPFHSGSANCANLGAAGGHGTRDGLAGTQKDAVPWWERLTTTKTGNFKGNANPPEKDTRSVREDMDLTTRDQRLRNRSATCLHDGVARVEYVSPRNTDQLLNRRKMTRPKSANLYSGKRAGCDDGRWG